MVLEVAENNTNTWPIHIFGYTAIKPNLVRVDFCKSGINNDDDSYDYLQYSVTVDVSVHNTLEKLMNELVTCMNDIDAGADSSFLFEYMFGDDDNDES